MTTAVEKAYLGLVASLPCAVCGAFPVQVHHIREGQGMAQRAPHWLAVPLCHDHHQGGLGIHTLGTRNFERMNKASELDLLARTVKAVFEAMGTRRAQQ